jgi:adenosine kinase
MKKIATTISNLPKKNENRKRIVIITQGADPVIVAIGKQSHLLLDRNKNSINLTTQLKGDEIREFPVPKIPSEQIIDTNGAGDAFVGGFLAQFVKDEGLDKCIDCGIWASGLIIQRSGCTFPETMDYK